jgi:hypothetical protein
VAWIGTLPTSTLLTTTLMLILILILTMSTKAMTILPLHTTSKPALVPAELPTPTAHTNTKQLTLEMLITLPMLASPLGTMLMPTTTSSPIPTLAIKLMLLQRQPRLTTLPHTTTHPNSKAAAEEPIISHLTQWSPRNSIDNTTMGNLLQAIESMRKTVPRLATSDQVKIS